MSKKDNPNNKVAVFASRPLIGSTADNGETRSVVALYYAMDIMREKKEAIGSQNLDAWFILSHAIQHLQSQLN